MRSAITLDRQDFANGFAEVQVIFDNKDVGDCRLVDNLFEVDARREGFAFRSHGEVVTELLPGAGCVLEVAGRYSLPFDFEFVVWGSSITMRAPPPDRLSALIDPACCSMIWWAMKSPSPSPP